eukprot:3035373-Pyramimonas_sp.AAC.1
MSRPKSGTVLMPCVAWILARVVTNVMLDLYGLTYLPWLVKEAGFVHERYRVPPLGASSKIRALCAFTLPAQIAV